MATLFKRAGKGNWIVQWYDADGKRQTKSSRTTDHAAASRIAAKFEADVALRREGVIDSRLDRIAEQAGKPIRTHLDDFGAAMRSKSALDHIDDTRRMIERLCEFLGWVNLRDIDADGCNQYAAHLFALGRAARTVHAQLTAIRTFVTWAVRTGRLAYDPLATVAKPNVSSDRRVIRRFMSHDEYLWLDIVTRRAGDSYGMSGHARALLYAVAIQTGLRAGEIRKLTRGKLHLTGDQPFILAAAKTTKNKKQARQYVTADLAAELRVFVGRMLGGARVFDIPAEYDVASMLRADLEAARAAWLETFQKPQKRIEADQTDFLRADDSEGERLDFHALRHTCASWLIAAGAEIKTVQAVMRHSDIRLTMDRYGHLFPGKEAEAIDLLGSVFNRSQPLRATGTTDGDSGALHLAQHPARETVRNAATGRSENCSALNQRENHSSKENWEETQHFVTRSENSGGGIRTPDTRIMIPHGNQQNAERNDSALQWAQHSFQKWAVLLVDSQGQILEKIATDKACVDAVAFAANWHQGRNRGNVVVVVPELAIEPLTGNC